MLSQVSSTPFGGFTSFRKPDSQSVFTLLDVYSEVSDGLHDQKTQLSCELAELEMKRETITKRLASLLKHANIFQGSGDDTLKMAITESKNYETIDVVVVCVSIDVITPGPINLEMSYQIRSARWTPAYDIRVHGNVTDVQYFGNILQWSAEDWAEVGLSLSSSNLNGQRLQMNDEMSE